MREQESRLVGTIGRTCSGRECHLPCSSRAPNKRWSERRPRLNSVEILQASSSHILSKESCVGQAGFVYIYALTIKNNARCSVRHPAVRIIKC